jgi:hypothetical protein
VPTTRGLIGSKERRECCFGAEATTSDEQLALYHGEILGTRPCFVGHSLKDVVSEARQGYCRATSERGGKSCRRRRPLLVSRLGLRLHPWKGGTSHDRAPEPEPRAGAASGPAPGASTGSGPDTPATAGRRADPGLVEGGRCNPCRFRANPARERDPSVKRERGVRMAPSRPLMANPNNLR